MSALSRAVRLPLLAFAAQSMAATYYVDAASGSASNPGSKTAPWAHVESCFQNLSAGDVCQVATGVYNFRGATGTFRGTVAKSGTAAKPIVVQAAQGAEVVFENTISTQGLWTRVDGNLWRLAIPSWSSLQTEQSAWKSERDDQGVALWSSDYAPMEAAWPNRAAGSVFPAFAHLASGSSIQNYNVADLPSGSLTGAKAHVLMDEEFGSTVRTVTGRPSTSTIGVDNESDDAILVGNRLWLSGHASLVDATWEWALDADAGTITMLVGDDVDPNDASVDLRLQTSGAGPDLRGRTGWTFRNIEFRGVAPVTSASSAALTFERNRFLSPGVQTGEVATSSAGTGFVLNGSGHALRRNAFENCPNSCLEVGSSATEIENNTFSEIDPWGRGLRAAVLVSGSDVVVSYNRIQRTGSEGILVTAEASDVTVRRNRIEGWNQVAAARSGGIHLMGPSSGAVLVDSNEVFAQADQSSMLVDSRPAAAINVNFARSNATVFRNVVDDAVVGIRLGGRVNSANELGYSINNWVVQNTVGPDTKWSLLSASIDQSLSQRMNGTVVWGNVFQAPLGSQSYTAYYGSDLTVAGTGTFTGLGATWGPNLLADQDALFLDPGAEAWDYGPAAASPVVDASSATTLPNGYGTSSGPFVTGLPDLGAIELGTSFEAGPLPDPGDEQEEEDDGENDVLGFENLALWSIPSDMTASLVEDHTQGNTALAAQTSNWKLVVESTPVDQDAVGGTGFLDVDLKISSVQPNPWWLGAVQFYVECPSRNLYNQWVGQVELTGKVQEQWFTSSLPLPSWIAQQLSGATYSDLVVKVAFNLVGGAGPLLIDNIRFSP